MRHVYSNYHVYSSSVEKRTLRGPLSPKGYLKPMRCLSPFGAQRAYGDFETAVDCD